MKSQNIVCFAKDWTENPTSCTHVLRLLAHDNQVLWLNSIASRTPRLSSARDLRTIARKLRGFAAGPHSMTAGLTTLTPIVLPFPHSPLAMRANRAILRSAIHRQRERLQMAEFQAWTFLPTAAPFIGTLGEALSVYYCTDEWSQFSSVDGGKMEALERELCGKVDLIFAAARSIVDKKRALNPETHLIPHGVDRDHFATALAPETTIPDDIAAFPRPLIGFFGLIEDWIDVELFVFLARQRPEWSIVVIGQSHIPLEHLPSLPNLHFIGRRAYSELPRYAKAFSVGLCPFRINELTMHVNPIKLREYLSAGLPVVSSDIPECRVREDWGRVARTHEEFLAQIQAVLKEDSPAARSRRSLAMKAETWERKVEEIGEHVMRVRNLKMSRAQARGSRPLSVGS
jgi:glycosyltransferase involved in cell wall biosynthesis